MKSISIAVSLIFIASVIVDMIYPKVDFGYYIICSVAIMSAIDTIYKNLK